MISPEYGVMLRINVCIVFATLQRDRNPSVIDTKLSELPYSRRARFDSKKVCLPLTRTAILEETIAWISRVGAASSTDRKRILLLHGMAGTGKSTIANTIASWYYQLKRLGGSFCFKRGDRERSSDNMFSTIARGMADLEEAYKLKLYEVIKSDTLLRTSGMYLYGRQLCIVSFLSSDAFGAI
jgi:hypothetical protein